MTTSLGYGIRVNPSSSLTREWVTINDSVSPVQLDGNVGVTTVYRSGGAYSSGEYQYRANLPVSVLDDVTAFEVRFVLFDVWGEFTKTLSTTKIEDLATATRKSFESRWSIYGENEVAEHYASLAYVARARTKSGRVFDANFDAVLEEARRINERFAPAWLNPHRRPQADTTTISR